MRIHCGWLSRRIADIAEPLPRTLVWSAAWEDDPGRRAAGPRLRRPGVARVHAESEVGVAQRLLQAQTALNSYARAGWAATTGWPAFADRLLELARRPARLGSSAGLRQRAVHQHSPHHLVLLADLLDHDPSGYGLPGLVVDTDLRWRIVTALAPVGRSTPTGRRRRSSTPSSSAIPPRPAVAASAAAAAAACRPTSARAWREVIEGRHPAEHHGPVDHHRFRPARSGRRCSRPTPSTT